VNLKVNIGSEINYASKNVLFIRAKISTFLELDKDFSLAQASWSKMDAPKSI
jgi:hypothetical protein